MKENLDKETRSNLDSISSEFKSKWGRNGVWNPVGDKYKEKTVVRSGQDALDAFEKYTEYYEYVLDNWTPNSNDLVLVPCGSSKPIGSSSIHQKKIKAIRNGGLENSDIVVVSEPCVVVPPEYRLSLPAANYDFPPEYTDKNNYPQVFKVFTDRLAEWMDTMHYENIFPFLIEGHMNKFEVAKDKIRTNPNIYSIPSASYNASSESYSGDRFKKQKEMNEKVKAVLKYKAGRDVNVSEEYSEFYKDRFK